MLKVLIFEDEIPAYQKLLAYIGQQMPDAQIVGWARSIEEALALLRTQAPALIFSDIELLDGLSFSIFEQEKASCPIIFCTAYDRYILQAFRENGIAYLLKPYDEAEFAQAIQKYRTLFAASADSTPLLSPGLVNELKTVLQQEQNGGYKKRFAVKKRDGIKLLEVQEVACFIANGDFVLAHDVQGRQHALTLTLSSLESQLDPALFFRINRSEIVRVDCITHIAPYFKNRLVLTLKGLNTSLHTSESRTPAFRRWVEGA